MDLSSQKPEDVDVRSLAVQRVERWTLTTSFRDIESDQCLEINENKFRRVDKDVKYTFQRHKV
jgi:hypothetical protein